VKIRPKVLFVGPTPPPLHGPSIYVHMILNAPTVNNAVELIHLDISDRRDLGNIGRLDVRNVRLALEHLVRAAWICMTRRPDVVYVQPSQNSLAYLRDAGFIFLGWLVGARVVVHLHGESFAHFREGANPAVRLLIDVTHARVTEAWVLGHDLRGQFQHLVPAGRIRVLPNGIPRAMQERVEAALMERSDGLFHVLHLGQLARSKGTDRVVRAVAELRARGVDARLTLAGGWGSVDDERALSSLIAELGGDWLHQAGVVDGDAKAELLAGADVFVLASRFPPGEGQPLAVLEAMAASVAVVATPRGAIPETLAWGKAGRLVDVDASESLADALEVLARDPEGCRALGRAGRERFLAEYTEGACTERVALGLRAVAARGSS
jgi:glycosyltransferase involved in cell wall biosynthesis